jgi:hypothetical protein
MTKEEFNNIKIGDKLFYAYLDDTHNLLTLVIIETGINYGEKWIRVLCKYQSVVRQEVAEKEYEDIFSIGAISYLHNNPMDAMIVAMENAGRL